MIATALLSAAAWAEPLHRTDLLKNDIKAPGYQIVQVRVDFAPGSLAPRYSHPGERR